MKPAEITIFDGAEFVQHWIETVANKVYAFDYKGFVQKPLTQIYVYTEKSPHSHITFDIVTEPDNIRLIVIIHLKKDQKRVDTFGDPEAFANYIATVLEYYMCDAEPQHEYPQ